MESARHTKSNGILIARDGTTVGLGAGQVSRVDAVHMALRKGGENVEVVFLPQMLFSHLEIALIQLKLRNKHNPARRVH